MNTGIAPADYIIMVGFFAVLLYIGVFYSGRMQNLRDFFGGGRQVPWWLAGVSLYMTSFSSFAFVAYSAIAYQYGFVAIAIWWFSIPGCLLSAHFLASRWRRAATTSPVEYIETRFGPGLRQCFSWFGIPLIVLDDALKLFVIGAMVSASAGLESDAGVLTCIAICGSIILAYTFMGGLWAVLITDALQFVVMSVSIIVLLPLAWNKSGGMRAIIEHLPIGFSNITAATYTWPWMLSFAFVLALTFATKWPYVQRYYAVRSDKEARWVGYLVAILTFVSFPLLLFPALAARVFLPNVADANTVYVLLCKQLLPVGMMGVMLAAMFSATMSMLSSDYNSVASVVTNDIIKRLFMQAASDRSLVLTARLTTFAIGMLAMLLAMLFAKAKGLEDLVQYMARLFAGLLPPVALPMIAGLVSKKTSNAGALTGFVFGAVCGVVGYVASYVCDWPALRDVTYLAWITSLPSIAGLVIGSYWAPNSVEKSQAIDLFLAGLTSKREKVSIETGGDAAVAMRILGMTTTFLGVVLALGVLVTSGISAGRLSVLVGTLMAAAGIVGVLFSRQLEPSPEAKR